MPYFELVGEVKFGKPRVVRTQWWSQPIFNNTMTVMIDKFSAVKIPILFKDKKTITSLHDRKGNHLLSVHKGGDSYSFSFDKTTNNINAINASPGLESTGVDMSSPVVPQAEKFFKFLIDKMNEDFSSMADECKLICRKVKDRAIKKEVDKIINKELNLVANLSVDQFRLLYPVARQLASVNVDDLMKMDDEDLKTVFDQAKIGLIHKE